MIIFILGPTKDREPIPGVGCFGNWCTKEIPFRSWHIWLIRKERKRGCEACGGCYCSVSYLEVGRVSLRGKNHYKAWTLFWVHWRATCLLSQGSALTRFGFQIGLAMVWRAGKMWWCGGGMKKGSGTGEGLAPSSWQWMQRNGWIQETLQMLKDRNLWEVGCEDGERKVKSPPKLHLSENFRGRRKAWEKAAS